MFYREFKKIISESLKSRKTIKNLILELKDISEQSNGKIGFFPCGKLTADILREIKLLAPELESKIFGCFDESTKATTEKGFKTFHINEFHKFKNDISILIVASNTYYSKEMNKLKNLNTSNMSIKNISFFETSLPSDMDDDEIMSNIDYIYKLLSDEKSKIIYMIAWLSRLLNDEQLTQLFGAEENFYTDEEPIKYKDYTIHGLDFECKKELFSELYRMRHVSPEKGDVIFDIGAYLGDSAIFFANYVKDKGKVYAFEPIKPNYNQLKNNIEFNSLSDIIQIENIGISNRSGTLKGVTSDEGGPWSFLGEERGDIDVEVTTIDEFVKSNNVKDVDYIKIDVEGLEKEVIEGATETIRNKKPKLAVAIYHNTSDLITLPLQINKICKYKLYIRSKVDGPFGFTLYTNYGPK